MVGCTCLGLIHSALLSAREVAGSFSLGICTTECDYTPEEDKIIMEMQNKSGNKWAQVSEVTPVPRMQHALHKILIYFNFDYQLPPWTLPN